MFLILILILFFWIFSGKYWYASVVLLVLIFTLFGFAKNIYQRQKNLWDQKIGTEIQFLTAKNNKEALEKKMARSKDPALYLFESETD